MSNDEKKEHKLAIKLQFAHLHTEEFVPSMQCYCIYITVVQHFTQHALLSPYDSQERNSITHHALLTYISIKTIILGSKKWGENV